MVVLTSTQMRVKLKLNIIKIRAMLRIVVFHALELLVNCNATLDLVGS